MISRTHSNLLDTIKFRKSYREHWSIVRQFVIAVTGNQQLVYNYHYHYYNYIIAQQQMQESRNVKSITDSYYGIGHKTRIQLQIRHED